MAEWDVFDRLLMLVIAALLLALVLVIAYYAFRFKRRADAFTDDNGQLRIPKVDLKDVKGLAAYAGLVHLGIPVFNALAGRIMQWASSGPQPPMPTSPILPEGGVTEILKVK